MYHTHMHESLISVTSTVSVSDASYAYARLTRRDDSDSSSSSASSTKNSKSAECTGSKQQCQLPTDSSHSTSVTVGVAVAVPVGVIIIVLAVILCIVYRRSKKEAEEDNDPDFEGDSEFLPTMKDYSPGINHLYSSDSQQDFMEKTLQQPPSDPFVGSMHSSKYNVRSATPPAIGRSWYVDPFQLPQESNDSNSLRDFAMRVQEDGLGGYKVAAESRNASQTSLHPDNFSNCTPIRASSRFQESESFRSHGSPIHNNQLSRGSATEGANKQFTFPNEDNDSSSVSEEAEVLNESNESASNDAFEFELDNSSEKTHERNLRFGKDDDNYELQDIREAEHMNDRSSSKSQDDDYYVSLLSPNEEEDIKRMKSIYQVYLDRAKTMKKEEDKADNANDISQEENRVDNIVQNPLPSIKINNNDNIDNNEAPEAKHLVKEALPLNNTNLAEYGPEMAQSQKQYPVQDTLTVNDTEAAPSNRIASSIYSEAIQPLNYQDQYQQQEQSPVYNGHTQYPGNGYSGNPQQQGYTAQFVQNPQWYGVPTPQQQQHNHPQTLETIGELPTPAYLAQSASSHSLTSFKRPNKQQLLQLQTARLNGTALNPVDHPEMFYSPTNDAYYAPQQQGQYMKFNENGAVPSPYQLRQSVVMTNPSDLTAKPSYKPAGSFRSVSATNSRNNSLTTQNNIYLQQQQQQLYNSRVSGILEETDVVQPPSVGGILPHSGSQDDLRKQLGSSHNYTVN
ncbi:CBM_collapsed_G0026690.mRNA.1.CDS.1 [Saccharomyces cerevisiae]|nr:CBM_collapsed_G0026690.mRNA.1.CDS.1 [Saccharomyces cerevisiae]